MSLLMTTTFTNSSCDVAQCSIPSIGALDLLVRLLVQSIFTQQCNISPKESWPRDHAEVAVHEQSQTYDFVIVGGGSAGSVVASRLSENPQFNVLVLEEGTDPPQESEVGCYLKKEHQSIKTLIAIIFTGTLFAKRYSRFKLHLSLYSRIQWNILQIGRKWTLWLDQRQMFGWLGSYKCYALL